MTRKPLSFAAAVFVTLLLFCAVTFYYPKYNAQQTEATISWDVAGYYYYLPAFFVYKDPKQLGFTEAVMEAYRPSGQFDMAMRHEASGNYVMKYSSGQSLMYMPFFWIGHIVALQSETYPADGFSLPYQAAIAYGALVFCLIGLWLMRRLLLRRFSDGAVAVTILCMAVGTNYFEYASTSAVMTHGHLFTLYAVLILLTERFYSKPTVGIAAAIGAVVGLCALTRPTEIIAAIIPTMWGIGFPLLLSVRKRVAFFSSHWRHLIVAAVCTLCVGMVQVVYWKYATGSWLVYSYGDQSFSWLRPHLVNGLWSYNNGWLTYSPMLYFALAGLAVLWWKRSSLAPACTAFAVVFLYVTFAWDIWWYGGSLGQRAMVQSYAVLMFGFAGFVNWLNVRRARIAFGSVAVFFVYYNLWLVHQAHHGGKYKTGETTRAYFWKTFLTCRHDPEELKLLDTNELFEGKPSNPILVYANDFESDTTTCTDEPIYGIGSICLPPNGASPEYNATLENADAEWLRVAATFRCRPKEWDTWQMPQLVIRYYNGGEKIKEKMIRVYRAMNEGETKQIFIDSRIPDNATRVTAHVWNASQSKPATFDALRFETFNEED